MPGAFHRKTIRGRVPFSVLIEPETYTGLCRIAAENHRTVAAEVRRLLEAHTRDSDTRPATEAERVASQARQGS